MSNIQRTPHGFDWNCAKIECLASDEKKGWIYLGVTTPKDSIEIYKSAPTSQGDLFARRALRAVSAPCIWNGNTAPAVLDALHLQQMKKSPDFIRGISYRNI